MQELHVTIDPDGADPAVQRLQEPLEAQLTSALQRAAEVVEDDYHGESVDEVSQRLLEVARASLHPDIAGAWLPDQRELRQAAEAIVSDFH
ncbi:hypothetical protein [Dactylosporangium sp. NPDC049140]|uniref:hypothetical protein n=1 Tax=Dactylosporangium sp. NPDC049140 TaxID=3155647 RepID=UPI0033C6FB2D